jgi:hypothetical protein
MANLIQKSKTEDIVKKLAIPESQKEIYLNSVYKVIRCTAKLTDFENKMKKLRSDLNDDPRTRQLKDLKKKIKMVKSLNAEAIATANGALEMALSEIPGNSIEDKLNLIGGENG